jgi:phosphate uptake regulator
VTEEEIALMRSRIAALEQGDADFARRSNLLLDEILLTREQADANTRAIDNLLQVSAQSRRDIDQLADRIGDLAQEASQFRQELRELNQARREDIQVMVSIVDSLSTSVRIAVEQSQASLAGW